MKAPVTPVSADRGVPLPLGVSYQGSSVNFSLASHSAKQVALCLFTSPSTLFRRFDLDPIRNRTGDIWHIRLKGALNGLLYAYSLENSEVLLLDPYATVVHSPHAWQTNLPIEQQQEYHPLGLIWPPTEFDWENDRFPCLPQEDLLIYEMHVRGFTQHHSSGVSHPGSFLGVIEKIDHLKSLGVNAVELLPVFEFNEAEYNCCALEGKDQLCNYWGYSSVSFFSLMNRYAAADTPGAVINEFKQMVKALHQAGIEIILDVVYNHTAEGGKFGPTYSFKGIDKAIYYIVNERGDYIDYTGCGNTVNANQPVMGNLIIDSLRYWVAEMHVDGFRFDLASIFHRSPTGEPIDPSDIVEAISADPLLAQTKLIAEPWDAQGLYQVGSFYKAGSRWSEWNGQYRDLVRKFIKGTPYVSGMFATRICGSQDLYGAGGSPLNSINFITCHDGFTLQDLVSYNQKHNLNNGENNRDGLNENESWNCGTEGPSQEPSLLRLRGRQLRNHHLALMVSRGIPMLHMGDEYGHTKQGNNNSWCHDNELNWFQWDQLKANAGFFRFYRLLIQFRKKEKLLSKDSFVQPDEVVWHGAHPHKPNWSPNNMLIAYQLLDLIDGHDLFIAFNAGNATTQLWFPDPPKDHAWHYVVNTAQSSPKDICELDQLQCLATRTLRLIPHSAILLKAIK